MQESCISFSFFSPDISGVKAAEILIAAGADVNAVNIYGQTPLLENNALCEYHQNCLISVHKTFSKSKSKPFTTGQEDVVELLIKNGADVNYRGWGSAPLHRAARISN